MMLLPELHSDIGKIKGMTTLVLLIAVFLITQHPFIGVSPDRLLTVPVVVKAFRKYRYAFQLFDSYMHLINVITSII